MHKESGLKMREPRRTGILDKKNEPRGGANCVAKRLRECERNVAFHVTLRCFARHAIAREDVQQENLTERNRLTSINANRST